MDCNLPGFSVHGIFQARVLEWVAISFSRGNLPDPGIKPQTPVSVSCIVGIRFTIWTTTEAHPWRVAFCYENISRRISLPLLSTRSLFLTLYSLTGFLKANHSSVGLRSTTAILDLISVYMQHPAINQNHHLYLPSSLWFHSLLLCVSRS